MSENDPAVVESQPAAPDDEKRPSNKLAVFAILLSLLAMAAVAAAGWYYLQQQDTAQRTQQEQNNELGVLRQQLNGLFEQQQQVMAERQLGNDRITAVIDQQQQHSQQLAELALVERDDWKLAEVEYLLRLAHQRIVLGSDADGALQLLQNADDILFELGYSDVYAVRKQIAEDIAAVHTIVKTDVEGTYLQLLGLSSQVSNIPFEGMQELPEFTDTNAAEVLAESENTWLRDAQTKAAEAWALLKQLVVVKERTVNIQPLLSAKQRQLIDGRLKLNLAQARSALLLQQQEIYQASLAQAQQLITSFYQADSNQGQQVLTELAALAELTVNPPLPDISGSQRAIKIYLNERLIQKNPLEPVQ